MRCSTSVRAPGLKRAGGQAPDSSLHFGFRFPVSDSGIGRAVLRTRLSLKGGRARGTPALSPLSTSLSTTLLAFLPGRLSSWCYSVCTLFGLYRAPWSRPGGGLTRRLRARILSTSTLGTGDRFMTTIADRNASLAANMAAAVADRGYAVVSAATPLCHASLGVVRGWGGYTHPRPLCQGHTTRIFYALSTDQKQAVTCKRCLASLSNLRNRRQT